jgi:hypothetical protein
MTASVRSCALPRQSLRACLPEQKGRDASLLVESLSYRHAAGSGCWKLLYHRTSDMDENCGFKQVADLQDSGWVILVYHGNFIVCAW